MAPSRPQVIALIALTLCVGGNPTTRAPRAPVAQAAPPELVSELGSVVERARQRFEARDAPGVLAHVSEQYRSGGLTKADLRQQLLAMFALDEVLRAGVTIGACRSSTARYGSTRAVKCPVACLPRLGDGPDVAERTRGGAA
jgi:hypothetical protein